MMNKKRLMAILAAGVLTATSFNPAMIKAESVSAEEAGMAVPADAATAACPPETAHTWEYSACSGPCSYPVRIPPAPGH